MEHFEYYESPTYATSDILSICPNLLKEIQKELEKQKDVYKMTAEEYMQLENKL